MASEPEETGGIPSGSPRELIVVLRQEAEVATTEAGLASRSGFALDDVTAILRDSGAVIHPLFGPSEDRVRFESAAAPGPDDADAASFYQVEAADSQLDQLAEALAATESVEAAYVKPPAYPATLFADVAPAPDMPPAVTPDFSAQQRYLDAAPAGIDARWAWTQAGGRGRNVQIIDIEGAWRYSHEDLRLNQGGVVGGTQSGDLVWRNHGTAVIGVYGGDQNGFGVTGIASDANCRAHSIFGSGNSSAAAIRAAAQRLNAGDILLIELHRPGPRFAFASRADQRGYIAIEWWPDDLAALQFATGRGVIVVEAAGNGAENLDDAIYGTRPSNFPASWRNPFNTANPSSRCVLVGAGAPPSGAFGPDRSRLDFSNFGARVDAQGYGRQVVTTGYGDLQGGTNEDLWYTSSFSGTSSASPIVVGALACIQGILRARGATLLTPDTARARLRATGSPQTDAPGRPATQRIGNRPNIRGVYDAIFPKNAIKDVVDSKRVKEVEKKAEIKEIEKKRETKEFEKKPEIKEKAEIKEKVEIKETKDFDKSPLEKIREVLHDPREILAGPAADQGLEARVAALEASLAHFIEAASRPEVGASVYGDEQERLRQEAQAQLTAAKDYKDAKDAEI